MRAFYDLTPDEPYGLDEITRLQHEGQIDRELQSVERACRRGDDPTRALARLHAREQRRDA